MCRVQPPKPASKKKSKEEIEAGTALLRRGVGLRQVLSSCVCPAEKRAAAEAEEKARAREYRSRVW